MVDEYYAIGFGVVINEEEKKEILNKLRQNRITTEDEMFFLKQYCRLINFYTKEHFYFFGFIFYLNFEKNDVLDAGCQGVYTCEKNFFEQFFSRYNLLQWLRKDSGWIDEHCIIRFSR